jgi:transcriptional regulator with XRE-family HTH domain
MSLKVKELRTKYGFSQRQLSEKTGVPEGRINNWEQGKGKPKADDYAKLVAFFESLQVKIPEVSRETIPKGTDADFYQKATDTLERVVQHQERLIERLESDLEKVREDLRICRV